MLRNESFKNNYNLTTEKIQDLQSNIQTDANQKEEKFYKLIMNSFMCKQTQKTY